MDLTGTCIQKPSLLYQLRQATTGRAWKERAASGGYCMILMMQMALLATDIMTATWMEAVLPQAPLPIPQMDIMGMDTRATMTTTVSSAPMVMEIHAMKMAALSVATMEMKMAARSLSGGGYFLPYREVRNMHFLLAIF